MEISFEPDDVQLEHIIRLLGNLTKSKGIVFFLPAQKFKNSKSNDCEKTDKVSYFYIISSKMIRLVNDSLKG